MTRDEFMAKYGDVEVTFSSYYKYTFTFTGALPDGSWVSVACGGNHDDIYRLEVAAGQRIMIRSLEPYGGGVYKDGEEVESFYDY